MGSAHRKWLWPAAALLLAGTIAVLLLDGRWWNLLLSLETAMADVQSLRLAILSQGSWAPWLFVGTQVLQVVFFPVPGEASGLLGGYLFGIWQGFLLSSLGLTLGSLLAFGLARFFCSIALRRLQPTRVYQRFNHLVHKGDYVVPLLLFLLPGFPKDSLSYLLGLSLMPWRIFLVLAAVGRMPGTLMLSLQGAQVYQGNYLLLVLLLLASLLLSLPFYLYRHRILGWLNRLGRQRPAASGAEPFREEEQP